MKTIYFALVFFLLSTFLYSTIINVPGDQPTIQEGINAAVDADTILVQPGTYVENINYNGKLITVASLFLTTQDTTYISQTIIDGNQDGSVVSIENSEGMETKLSGFTIRNGLGIGDWPLVRGGGIHIDGSAQPTITHCYIHDNFTEGDSNRGAGIYASSYFSRVSNCKIYNNVSHIGSAISIGNWSNGVEIDSCKIYNNTDTCLPNLTSRGVITIGYSSNTSISRTLIHHNDGTGIRNFGSDNTNIIHCTISDNTLYGIYNTYFDTYLQVKNSIVSYNDELNIENNTANGLYDCWVNCEYSDILEGSGQIWFGTGCIDIDPLFVDPLNGDYNLTEGSLCIDSGDPTSPLDPDGTTADMGALFFDQRYPHADFSADITLGNSPLTVQFFDQSTLGCTGAQITDWFWDFGDDNYSLLQHPIHIYQDIGVYTVTLTITDIDGFSDTEIKEDYIEVTGIGTEHEIIPVETMLFQNHPNPFNPTTTINYSLKENSKVSLNIYNIKGQKVKQLLNGQQTAGQHSVIWNGTDKNGKTVSSGIYFYKLKTGNYEKTRKMILMK